jgi:hypothetical protein
MLVCMRGSLARAYLGVLPRFQELGEIAKTYSQLKKRRSAIPRPLRGRALDEAHLNFGNVGLWQVTQSLPLWGCVVGSFFLRNIVPALEAANPDELRAIRI